MASTGRIVRAELAPQEDPEIGDELIRVHFEDGSLQELRLHDYGRLYSLPGVYEQIVQERLGCRSPAEIAGMLAAAIDEAGWNRARARVIDLAAGNGVSGEALAAEGMRLVLGTDIVPAAREAALRDRPGLYDSYLTLDLLALSGGQERAVAELEANALACVVPVGDQPDVLPARALGRAAGLLTADAIVAYMYDPAGGVDDAMTPETWPSLLGAEVEARELERRRYLHRRTANGEPYEMEGVVWRLRRER
jgi:hypothetical protein